MAAFATGSAGSVLDLIGNTPVVRIHKLNPQKFVNLYAKLEYFNPSGSVKDRIAKYMVETAEKSGELTRDKIILEPTSGNTGIGLAMVAAAKGYKAVLVMPDSVSAERRHYLQALGAEVILTPGNQGTEGAIDRAYQIALKEPEKYYMPNQFNNPANVVAHYETTGAELIQQIPEKIDVFVAGIGTGGTIIGVAKRLREAYPNVRIVGVQPFPGEQIQGLRNLAEKFTPKIFEPALVDKIADVKPAVAMELARRLARKEGLFVGMSSGAVLYVALKEAKALKNGTVVTLFADGGGKYLSTKMFE